MSGACGEQARGDGAGRYLNLVDNPVQGQSFKAILGAASAARLASYILLPYPGPPSITSRGLLCQIVGVEVILACPVHGVTRNLRFDDGRGKHRPAEARLLRPWVGVHPAGQRLVGGQQLSDRKQRLATNCPSPSKSRTARPWPRVGGSLGKPLDQGAYNRKYLLT